MPRHTARFLAPIFFAALLAWSLPAQARVFSPDGEGFSVNMPGKPKTSKETHKSFVGAVHETSYTVSSGGVTYTASVSELPGAAVALGGTGTILSKARDGLLKDAGGTETAFNNITIGGKEGRQLLYDTASGSGQAKLTLNDKKLYIVVAAGPKAATAAITRFVNSFQLTSP
ncbi:MAG: hypothetical protein K8R69_03195 [Deltaproteobacteria bacterium]|nr:hypothetical protein [Deltaproteobacteria bacterium]